MEPLKALILGVVQGLGEFLPISSSGHLVLVQSLAGWEEYSLSFDVLLHVATLASVVVYFRRDLAHMAAALFSRDERRAADRRLAVLVIAATVPTGLIALALDHYAEELFTSATWVGVFLLVTAAFLTIAERFSAKSVTEPSSMRLPQALLVGVAQGLAVAPGISRAGATMAAGLGAGLTREQAARFSFLLSVPIIALAGLKTAYDVVSAGIPMPGWLPSIVGFAAAAVTGYSVIAGLLAYVRRRSLYVFAAYCSVVGVAVLAWQLVA